MPVATFQSIIFQAVHLKENKILLKHVNYDVDGFVLDSSKFSIIYMIIFNFSYHRNFSPIVMIMICYKLVIK